MTGATELAGARAIDLVRSALAALAALVAREGVRAAARRIADTGIRCVPLDHCDPRSCAVARYLTAQTGYPVLLSARGGCRVYLSEEDRLALRSPGTVNTPPAVIDLFDEFDRGNLDDLFLSPTPEPTP